MISDRPAGGLHMKVVLAGNDARLCKTELGRLKHAIVESTDPVLSFMTEPECPKWATSEYGASFSSLWPSRDAPGAPFRSLLHFFVTEMGCPKRAIRSRRGPF